MKKGKKIQKLIVKEEKIMRREWKNMIFNFLFMTLSILVVVLLYKKAIITTMLLIAITITGLIKMKSKLMIVIFIFFGILFGIIEIIVINYNVWSYSINSMMNVPFWLFILWGNTSVFIYQTALEIKKLGKEYLK